MLIVFRFCAILSSGESDDSGKSGNSCESGNSSDYSESDISTESSNSGIYNDAHESGDFLETHDSGGSGPECDKYIWILEYFWSKYLFEYSFISFFG